jgi:hypothetical protein
MKTYILGAGASFGYDENLPNELRPPKATEFFTKGIKLGIFSDRDFPDLFSALKTYLKKENLSAENCDIENFLQYLADDFSSISLQTPIDNNKIQTLQRALSQSFYFIYQLFRHYAIFYVPKFDNYVRLALHYNDCKYGIITLNYDVLFELALQSVGLNFHYFQNPHYPISVPLVKIHGSINWINPCQGGIAIGGVKKDIFRVTTQYIYSNRININSMILLPLQAIKQTDYKNFVRSGLDYDEPALIPPLSDYKDYEKVIDYKKIWNFAEFLLQDTSELVIIGCSIRPNDRKFRDLITHKLKDDTPITIVSPDNKDVMKKLKTLNKTNFKQTFEHFEQYAKTL